MVLGSSRDAEASLSPALSCLYGYDTYITVRTTSPVQNVPRGTLSRFASVPSVPRGTIFEALPPTIAHSYTWDAAGPRNQVYFFFVTFFAAFLAAARSCRVWSLPAAFHPKAPACQSRSRTAAPPGAQTSPHRE